MKTPKITWNGKRDYEAERDYRGRFTSFKRKLKWFCKSVLKGMGIGYVAIGLYVAGQINAVTPIVPVVEAETNLPPILARIAKCESPSGHTKNGKVVFNKNTNGSTDIGKFQINTIWLPKAAELGLNVLKEEDNQKMAEWIYENRGTGDWSSSSRCWSR